VTTEECIRIYQKHTWIRRQTTRLLLLRTGVPVPVTHAGTLLFTLHAPPR
jgi:hypothetical protein